MEASLLALIKSIYYNAVLHFLCAYHYLAV